MSCTVGLSINRYLGRHVILVPSSPLLMPTVTSVSSPNDASLSIKYRTKLKHPPRASAEGVPNELIEDSKFVPLNADDPVYGPPALLLLGFEAEEAMKIRQLLKELEGEFLKIIFCTEDMIPLSLWEAMHTNQSNLETLKIAESLPRICFLSGLSGEEMMMFIDAFPDAAFQATPKSLLRIMCSDAHRVIGLEPAVFAALVPNSSDKPLQELIEEIMGDHEMLTARKTSTT